MSDGTKAQMTEGDEKFLRLLTMRVRAQYAAGHSSGLVGCIERPDGNLLIIDSNGYSTDEEREIFLNLIRYHSIRSASRRAAVLSESWGILGHDEKIMAEVQRYVENGGRVSQHPLAEEMVSIVIESDAGSTFQSFSIEKRENGGADLIEHGPPHIQTENHGAMANFHVKSALRIQSNVLNWMNQMDQVAGGLGGNISVEGPFAD